jgi:hypothetical protein
VNPGALTAELWANGIDITADAAVQRLEEKQAWLVAVTDVVAAVFEARDRDRELIGEAVGRLVNAYETRLTQAEGRYRSLQASVKAPRRLRVTRDENGRAVAYDEEPLVADGSMTVAEYHAALEAMLGDFPDGNDGGAR